MRLIDADAFATFIKDVIKKQKYEDLKVDGLLTVADVLEAVISELEGTSPVGFKNAPTVNQWIPCSERLPKGQEIVNVSCHDDSGDTSYDYSSCGWVTGDGEYWIVDNEINSFVVAWMPLPEPYKGEE